MKIITPFSKNIRVCVLFFYFTLTAITPGFTIEIVCASGGNECFTGAEPEVISISYRIKASHSSDLIVGSSIKWTVRGGKIEGPSSGNERRQTPAGRASAGRKSTAAVVRLRSWK